MMVKNARRPIMWVSHDIGGLVVKAVSPVLTAKDYKTQHNVEC